MVSHSEWSTNGRGIPVDMGKFWFQFLGAHCEDWYSSRVTIRCPIDHHLAWKLLNATRQCPRHFYSYTWFTSLQTHPIVARLVCTMMIRSSFAQLQGSLHDSSFCHRLWVQIAPNNNSFVNCTNSSWIEWTHSIIAPLSHSAWTHSAFKGSTPYAVHT